MKLNVTNLWRVKSRVFIFVFALTHILLLSVLVWKTSPWLTGDSERYLALADSLANGNGFGLETINGYEPEGMRAPGYPIFVIIGKTLSGDSNFGIILLHIVLYFASVWLVWKITSRIINRECGFVFLFISSVYPFIMYSVGQISPEIPTVFLLALAVFLLLELSVWRIVGAAALIGLSVYFRPNLIFLNVILFAILVYNNYRDWRKPLLVVFTAFLVAAPFALRNYLVFGNPAPLPVIKGAGNSLMLTSWMSKISFNSLIKYGMTGEITEEVRKSRMIEQIAGINEQVGVPGNTRYHTLEFYPTNETKLKADELLGKTAVENISANPFGYFKVVFSNSIRMWFSSQMSENYSRVLQILLLLNGVLAALFGFIGLAMAFRKRNEQNNFIIMFLSGVFAYFIATLSWLHTEARYTITVRLFVLMFAAYFICELWKFYKNRFLIKVGE